MPPVTRPAFDLIYGISEAQICNTALGHIGAEVIQDTNEDSKQSRACRAVYAQTRDELLRTYPFNFATKITRIPFDEDYTLPLDEFMYAYKAEDWLTIPVSGNIGATVNVPAYNPINQRVLLTQDLIGREPIGVVFGPNTRITSFTSNEIGAGSITFDRNPLSAVSVSFQCRIPILKILEIEANDNNIYEVVGGGEKRRILANVGMDGLLELKYVEQVIDPNKFDSMFTHALALRIASKIAIDLTRSASVVQMLQQEFSAIFQAAKISASEERQIDSPDPWWTDRQAQHREPVRR